MVSVSGGVKGKAVQIGRGPATVIGEPVFFRPNRPATVPLRGVGRLKIDDEPKVRKPAQGL